MVCKAVTESAAKSLLEKEGYNRTMNSIYDLHFKDTEGNDIAMSQYKDKALLIVNTATKCGLAGQLEELEALSQEFKDKGLVVIGFPCDQFMGQEPETNETVVGVCRKNFGVTFLLSEKVNVNGPDTHPAFQYLKDNAKSPLGKKIKWNFTKFLINRDGTKVERFAPQTTPFAMRAKIEVELGA